MPKVDTSNLLRHAPRPAGRATDILKECQSWRPVQHLIVYNASGTSDARLAASWRQTVRGLPTGYPAEFIRPTLTFLLELPLHDYGTVSIRHQKPEAA